MTQTAVATIPTKQSLVAKFASKYSIESEKLLVILKATAFKVDKGPEVTNEQMAALLVVADQYGLNPFTREIFAFPDKKNGIVPVVGVDGWSRIVNDHPQSDGFEFRQAPEMTTPKDAQPCPEWMEVVIYRKDRGHPIVVREYIDEVYRKPYTRDDGSKVLGPWQTHTKRFLRHKTFIQGARIAYGFSGIYDEDEAERIIEAEVVRVPEGGQTERGAGAALKGALGIGKPPKEGAATAPGEPQGSEQTVVEREPGSDDEPTLAEAVAEIASHRDVETMRVYAEGLPEAIRSHESFTKAFAKRLGDMADASYVQEDTKGGKKPGTPALRKKYIERFGRADSETLDVCFDETRGFIWSKDDLDLIIAAYKSRK
jgi:phage recombination protein Bet